MRVGLNSNQNLIHDMKELKTTGHITMLVDQFGHLTPMNPDVYKSEADINKAHDKGNLPVPEQFAGIVVLEVKNFVDVKPAPATKTAKAEGNKGNAKQVETPKGEAKKNGE